MQGRKPAAVQLVRGRFEDTADAIHAKVDLFPGM